MKLKMLVLLMALSFAVGGNAKEIKVVMLRTSPEMHCTNCENKIRNNIRFEKGIKDIVTDLKSKTVTVKYDADKTDVERIIAGFAKIGYKASVVENEKEGDCSTEKKDARQK